MREASTIVPPITDKIWTQLLLDDKKFDFEFLGIKILLTRLKLTVELNPDPNVINKCAAELQQLFVRTARLPVVKKDIMKIIQLVRVMYDIDEVIAKLKENKFLFLAGDEKLLNKISEGNWIGGTIPYFMGEKGGLTTQEKIYVTELPEYISQFSIKIYDENTISNIFIDDKESDFSFIIIPASSTLHFSFALNAYTYKGFATRPLIGWIAGVHLDELGKNTPKVYAKGKKFENHAVVIHAKIPKNKYAEINILNIFEQGNGDVIKFLKDGFQVEEALINGKKMNFADYIIENKIDTRFPLVANYSGAMINTSFQSVDKENKVVKFYAPVFKGMKYKQARIIKDYISEFNRLISKQKTENVFFACNCILNYLYAELEGKKTKDMTGPMTFGEIAYQLVNQTMVYILFKDL